MEEGPGQNNKTVHSLSHIKKGNRGTHRWCCKVLKSYFFPKYLCTCGHIFSPDWKLKLAFDMKTLKFDEVGVQQIARNVSLQ